MSFYLSLWLLSKPHLHQYKSLWMGTRTTHHFPSNVRKNKNSRMDNNLCLCWNEYKGFLQEHSCILRLVDLSFHHLIWNGLMGSPDRNFLGKLDMCGNEFFLFFYRMLHASLWCNLSKKCGNNSLKFQIYDHLPKLFQDKLHTLHHFQIINFIV